MLDYVTTLEYSGKYLFQGFIGFCEAIINTWLFYSGFIMTLFIRIIDSHWGGTEFWGKVGQPGPIFFNGIILDRLGL